MSGTFTVPSVMSCTLSVIWYTKTSVVSILYPLFCDFSYYPSMLYCTDPLHFVLRFLVLHLYALLYWSPLTFFCDFSYCTSMLYCTDPPPPHFFCDFSYCTSMLYCTDLPPHFFLWFLVLHLIVLVYWPPLCTMYKRRKSEQLSMQTIIFDKLRNIQKIWHHFQASNLVTTVF
jgi:hypothetical protein